MTVTTIPAHTFEPAECATDADLTCGYVHMVDDETGVFCSFPADQAVHHGGDVPVRLRKQPDNGDAE